MGAIASTEGRGRRTGVVQRSARVSRRALRAATLPLLAAVVAGSALMAGSAGWAGAARAAGAAEPARGDPAARLPASDTANERWDLTALFEDGGRLFVRFLVTNEGPGTRTAACTGTFVFADGRVRTFEVARLSDRWSAGDDGLFLDVGSAELDLHPDSRGFSMNSHKRGIELGLRLAPAGPPAWDARPKRPGPRLDLIQLSAAEGALRFSDMPAPLALRGHAALTHAWTARRESDLVRRWLEVFAVAGDTLLYAVDLETPGGERWPWLVLQREGRLLPVAGDVALTAGPPSPGSDGGYPVPAGVEIRADGVRASLHGGRLLARGDPLELVPQPFRFILGLRMRPQRSWSDASLRLELAGADDPSLREGSGVLALWYLNPVD